VNAWRLRKRALKGDGGRLAYVEHTAEQVTLVGDEVVSVRPGVLDREAWARANSAYGRRISDESLLSLFDEMGEALFARECMCMWDPEPDAMSSVFPSGKWRACQDPKSGPDGDVSFALDVSPDRESASIVVAAESGRGGVHVEITGDDVVFDHRPGTDWVVPRMMELLNRWGGRVAVAKGSPAWSLEEDLRAAGIDIVEVSAAEHAQACGEFYDAVIEGQLRHLGQSDLDAAVAGADRKFYGGESWLWSRRASLVDITPLVAATLARWLAVKAPEPELVPLAAWR
jgi:hypothetical protein